MYTSPTDTLSFSFSTFSNSPIVFYHVAGGVKDDGQVLFLRDIQVVLNPDSNFRAVVPIILTSPIDVDLGIVPICCSIKGS